MPDQDKKKKPDEKRNIDTVASTQLTQQQTETATELLFKYSKLLKNFIEIHDSLDDLINMSSTKPTPR